MRKVKKKLTTPLTLTSPARGEGRKINGKGLTTSLTLTLSREVRIKLKRGEGK
jgi:hypothetical protein